jgi:hypothetical protein
MRKLVVCKLVKKFLDFYEGRMFIIVFTGARYWTLSESRKIQSKTNFKYLF